MVEKYKILQKKDNRLKPTAENEPQQYLQIDSKPPTKTRNNKPIDHMQ